MAAPASLLVRQMGGLTLTRSHGMITKRLGLPLVSLSGQFSSQNRLASTLTFADTRSLTNAARSSSSRSGIQRLPFSTVASPVSSVSTLPSPFTPKKYAWMDLTASPRKLKPYILKRRRNKLRTYVGTERGIRHSPWRMNLVCQMAAGLTLEDAIQQLEFCNKMAAPIVQKVLRRTSNLADIRDSLKPAQLEVAECFATHGSHLKRTKIMGRGNAGRMLHRHSHIRAVLREIDFPMRIYQAKTVRQKQKWVQKMELANQEHQKALSEREELERLEREAKAKAEGNN